MRVIRFGVLVGVMATVLACSTAFGQGQGGGGGGRPGGMMQSTVAQVPAAMLEQPLQLTADQREKITTVQTKLRADMRALFGQGGQGGGDRGAMMQKVQERNTKATQDIEAVLTADQKAKLPELLKKLHALRMCGIPTGVVADLKLTDEQSAKLQKLADDHMPKVQQARQNGANMQHLLAMEQDMQRQAREVLTDDQKATLDKYVKEHPLRGIGGRGGRGGGAGGGGNR